jgi:hypothetical protein
MTEIPVSFESGGKRYNGVLSKVSGAAQNALYHLSVENRHWGQLSRRFTALRCGGIPCYVILNLLLKFNSSTIVQHLFISQHIAKPML